MSEKQHIDSRPIESSVATGEGGKPDNFYLNFPPQKDVKHKAPAAVLGLGAAHDAVYFHPVLEQVRIPGNRWRKKARLEEVVADKAYDAAYVRKGHQRGDSREEATVLDTAMVTRGVLQIAHQAGFEEHNRVDAVLTVAPGQLIEKAQAEPPVKAKAPARALRVRREAPSRP